MDLQRRRFFEALGRIADAQQSQAERDRLVPYLQELGRAHRNGQHISVQTPHWPRLWCTYSIANAPRPDGLIRLHVRAVSGGLVSPVLVHQVRAGDPLVLGAPGGAMSQSL
jgi:ferredoxin-NADP reductase